MRYYKDDDGNVYAYEQQDLDTVNVIAQLEADLNSAQEHLDSLPVPTDLPEDAEDDPHAAERQAYAGAQNAVADAQAALESIPNVFFTIREKLQTLTLMTQQEVDAHLNPPVDPEQLADAARAQRDSLLTACDWVVMRAQELGEPVPQEWADYRQALRDVPQQEGFPETIEWPVEPESV